MDRREFLARSACLMAGSLFGLSGISKAFAIEKDNTLTGFSPPRVALIIDDIGFSETHARQFLSLNTPITFSILPRLERSQDLAFEIHEHGHEIMLHQPMEPYNPDLDPGPGALYSGFSGDEITGIMEENIRAIPFAVGMNNHMGSKFTECKKEVGDALGVVNRTGLFFVDSLTTNHSMAYRTAKKLHMAASYRDRFLDNIPDEKVIYFQLNNLIKYAITYGHAIGIGHPYTETAKAIGRSLGNFEKLGVSLVYVSKVLTLRNSAIEKGVSTSGSHDFT
ncbi:exported hypothetical protein [uncultured Desulfobacterium sp.]|uniref:Divergent polysaccharide deacetylase n=1 Tax=uncultured Desulfobacterium sp. TaxID=201089 RepID=A0A445N328_9BACT|nr:exported hypothetical protein [uncultured Desulfobacterium sp.]